jgi:hypothetical protein
MEGELSTMADKLKIIYSVGRARQDLVDTEVSEWRAAGWDITLIWHDKDLAEAEKKIKEALSNHNLLLVNYYNPYSKEFLDSLNIFKAYYDSDCPYNESGKDIYSWFDWIFVGAVMYDKNTSMVNKAKEWGAKNASFWPYGICLSSLAVFNFCSRDRGIDIVFVGNFQNKTARLLKIYKQFPNIVVYSNTAGLKGLIRTFYYILKKKKGWYEGLSFFDMSLWKLFLKTKKYKGNPLELYCKSKIGFNMHQSSGPVNYRLYELNGCGVMQICDCKEGLGEVYALDKEVVAYETEEEAIEKIKYYLSHEEERIAIARDGLIRTIRDYTRLKTFEKAMKELPI